MKWREVTRSEIPWNWREIYKRVALSHKSLNEYLNQLFEESNRRTNMDQKDKEEVKDMDADAKSDEVLDEVEVDDDEDDDDEEDDDSDNDDDDDDVEKIEEIK
jgi:hypothetical protein